MHDTGPIQRVTSTAPSRAREPAASADPGSQAGLVTDPARLRAAAAELETTFLAEMLKAAGFGKPLESFSGGVGEDQFASLLVTEQARALVAAGGLGLTEHIFQALMEKQNASA